MMSDSGATFPYSLSSVEIKQSFSIIGGGWTIWIAREGSIDIGCRTRDPQRNGNYHSSPFRKSHKNKYF